MVLSQRNGDGVSAQASGDKAGAAPVEGMLEKAEYLEWLLCYQPAQAQQREMWRVRGCGTLQRQPLLQKYRMPGVICM